MKIKLILRKTLKKNAMTKIVREESKKSESKNDENEFFDF